MQSLYLTQKEIDYLEDLLEDVKMNPDDKTEICNRYLQKFNGNEMRMIIKQIISWNKKDIAENATKFYSYLRAEDPTIYGKMGIFQ